MLDKDSKQRINSARQILVGKVPDPKAQTVRHTDGDAGLRSRKKRIPFCNGMDTGSNFAQPEKGQTSEYERN